MPGKQTAEAQGAKSNAAINNGIRNPKGIRKGIISLAFLGLIPVTDYLARTGPLQWLLRQTVALIPGCAAASDITRGRMIPALSALYLFATYGASGAPSRSRARPWRGPRARARTSTRRRTHGGTSTSSRASRCGSAARTTGCSRTSRRMGSRRRWRRR
ncbi:hypothetical protein PG997_002242 [Apiospora hydei]|uniref:Uncharacterized protein n=1 Tax=Apiospora hydei TaxID=1337664 RepID=A0ABR1X8T2_9PEZI